MAIYFNSSAPRNWGVDETGHMTPVPAGYVVVNGQYVPPQTQNAPAQSAPVQNTATQSSPILTTSDLGTPQTPQILSSYQAPTIPAGFQQINNPNPDDYDLIKTTVPYSNGASIDTKIIYYGRLIPKATMINPQTGQRIIVRTDNNVGQYPSQSTMISNGYQMESSPGITEGGASPGGAATALASRPTLVTSSGQRISPADPNYDAYRTAPGVTAVAAPVQNNQQVATTNGVVAQAQPDYLQQQPQTQSAPIAPQGGPSGSSGTSSSAINLATGASAPTTPLSTMGAPGSAFTGQHLVKFSSDPNGAGEGDAATVWLVDDATKSLRPFMSESALNAYFGSAAPSAWASIQTYPVTELGPTGSLASFKTLDHTSGIQSDGKMLKPTFSVSGLQGHYGNTSSVAEQDQLKTRAIEILKSIKMNTDNLLANGTLRGFTQQSLNAVFSDSTQLARMINAVAFGNYNGNDITKEAMRLAIVKEGHTELADKSIISDTKNKAAYSATDEYSKANAMPALAIPGEAAEKIMAATTRPEEFQKGVVTDLSSMKANIDKIGTTYYDLIDQANSATTERDHQVAQTNWNNFRDTLQKKYGISLAKNAIDAWGQIQDLQKNSSVSGLAGSGMANEAMDQYLKQVRTTDRVNRMSKLNESDKEEMAFYTASASPDQIAALVAADQASGLPRDQWKSVKYGLIPSDELKAAFDVETIFQKLKHDKPDQPDWLLRQQAQLSHDAILDKNGNLMSTMYGNLVAKKNQNSAEKLVFQQGAAMSDINKQNNAIFDQYTDPGLSSIDTFSQFIPPTTPAGTTTPTTPETPTTPTPAPAVVIPPGAGAPTTSTTSSSPSPITPVIPPTGSTAKATLYGPNNTTRVVTVGSTEASTLQSQGWGLTQGSYKVPAISPASAIPGAPTGPIAKATLYGPNNAARVVTVGSPEASTLQSQGWGLTQGSYRAPTNVSTSVASTAAAGISAALSSPPTTTKTTKPISFISGLNDAQKSSITALMGKSSWNATDLKNYNFATGQSLTSKPTI